MVYTNPYSGYSEDSPPGGRPGGQPNGQNGGSAPHYIATGHRIQVPVSYLRRPSESPPGSQASPQTNRGSQTALLPSTKEQWPRGSEHLFSCWAFSLSLHSLWSLPSLVGQEGGAAFLIIYCIMLLVIALPLLLLELALGQYSALPPARLYRHLCPLLCGLGVALTLQSLLRGMLDLCVLMWAGRGIFHLFKHRDITEDIFTTKVLNLEGSSLWSVGSLQEMLLVSLAIATLTTLLLTLPGTRALGKVTMVMVPTAFMLLVTLTIRACLAPGAPQAALALLTPSWGALTTPSVWLSAATQVVFSLQLGLGALTVFASYNKQEHNILRDTIILGLGHLVWILLSVLLTFALLGVSSPNSSVLLTSRDQGVYLSSTTLLQSSFPLLSQGWLWAGLYFILIIILGLTSLFGYVEVISSSLLSLKPSRTRIKPLLVVIVLVLLFLSDLVLACGGGVHYYHLLYTYISSWPCLLFSLLMVVATLLCHGTTNLMRDLGTMSRVKVHHWLEAHLSVIYYSILPVMLTACLCWQLYHLSFDHLRSPLSPWGLSLESEPWGLTIAWALAAIPLFPLLMGALWRLIRLHKGGSFKQHLRRQLKSSDRYYRNIGHLDAVVASGVPSRSSI